MGRAVPVTGLYDAVVSFCQQPEQYFNIDPLARLTVWETHIQIVERELPNYSAAVESGCADERGNPNWEAEPTWYLSGGLTGSLRPGDDGRIQLSAAHCICRPQKEYCKNVVVGAAPILTPMTQRGILLLILRLK